MCVCVYIYVCVCIYIYKMCEVNLKLTSYYIRIIRDDYYFKIMLHDEHLWKVLDIIYRWTSGF